MNEIVPVYKGEARLLRWNQGPNGRTITLELDPDAGTQHPFMGLPLGQKSGQRMQLVAVLIDDNEEPVPPPQVGTNGADNHQAVKSNQANASILEVAPEGLREKTPFRSMKRSSQAALKIKDDAEFRGWVFAQWLRKLRGLQLAPDTQDYLESVASRGAADELDADRALKSVLGIKSKTELDSDPAAGERWDRLLTSYTYKDRVS